MMSISVFLKSELIAQGKPQDVAGIVQQLPPLTRSSDLLAFDDETGRQVDLDLRPQKEDASAGRSRGRPALGVKAREVTLLPRHWDWLRQQRGGASASLRRLVEDAMKQGRSRRDCQDAAYRFLTAMAGDFPNFEDALRELYADNREGYEQWAQDWPPAVRDHGCKLAWPD